MQKVHHGEDFKRVCHLCPWRGTPKSLADHMYKVHGEPIPDNVKV